LGAGRPKPGYPLQFCSAFVVIADLIRNPLSQGIYTSVIRGISATIPCASLGFASLPFIVHHPDIRPVSNGASFRSFRKLSAIAATADVR
jgi:hypothetical protein